jgi:ATP-dependent RNA helicase RhlE
LFVNPCLASDRRSQYPLLPGELQILRFQMSFELLGLQPELLRAVAEKGYTTPSPIQSQAIPAVLAGGDLIAGAQTGTGKTAAFVLPMLQRLAAAPRTGRAPRALVLTPTRELAAQVAESARNYGKYLQIRTAVVFGGVGINPQIDAMRAGCDLLIATPGRLLDLAEQREVDLREVRCFVLDEADRMLDMGFIHAIRRVLKLLPPQRQNLMFSATYSEEIRELANRFVRNPVVIDVAPRNATADKVEQTVYRVSKENKRHLLAHLIDSGNWHQVLVFTRTKHGANRLAQQLEGAGIRSAAIHGNKSQGARVRALSDFKENRVTALVATEVAARGLDIKELPHVVNYELPNVPEDYVHRIGRTARAGTTGAAVSLVAPDEAPLLRDIERLLRRPLPVAALPEFPISASAAGAGEGGQRGGEERRGGNGSSRGGDRRGGSGHRGGDRPRGEGRHNGGGRPGGERGVDSSGARRSGEAPRGGAGRGGEVRRDRPAHAQGNRPGQQPDGQRGAEGRAQGQRHDSAPRQDFGQGGGQRRDQASGHGNGGRNNFGSRQDSGHRGGERQGQGRPSHGQHQGRGRTGSFSGGPEARNRPPGSRRTGSY